MKKKIKKPALRHSSGQAKKKVKKAASRHRSGQAKKKPVKKAVLRRGSGQVKKVKAEKPIGAVTHFYNHIKVAVIKFKTAFKSGGEVHFRGATTDFKQKLASMQYDHKQIAVAKKGQGVGAKVAKRVREGDLVFKAKQ